jgi:hypothetical protein
MDSRELDAMERQARRERTSMNAFLTGILRSHAEWERIAPTLELMPVQKPVVKDLLNHVPEEKLLESAYKSADYSLDRLLSFVEEQSLDSFLKITRKWLNKSGFVFSERNDEQGNLVLIVKHGMGRKLSVFSNAYYARVLQKLGYVVSTESREDLWVATIKMN